MIINKKRINSLSLLKDIEIDKEIIICVRDAQRFEKECRRIGFIEPIKDGQSLLPAVVNPTTRRNAEKYYVADKTKPKETVYRTFWWERKQWDGRGQTKIVGDFVEIPYKRYPRKEYMPYDVELLTRVEKDGSILLYTMPLQYEEKNKDLIKNTINIFLTQFGECEIVDGNLEGYDKQKLIRLNWEVLPSGKYPWEKIKNDIEIISKNTTKTNRHIFSKNTKLLHEFEPEFFAYGKAGFRGYIIFGYPSKKLYVLESQYPNNATYIFSEDWEKISKCSKADILNGSLHEFRFIHNGSWDKNINEVLK